MFNIIIQGIVLSKHHYIQVHPYKLTNALINGANSRGVEVLKGKVEGVEFAEKDERIFVKGKGYIS